MAKIDFFKPYVNERACELVAKTLRSGWIGEGAQVLEFESRIGRLVKSAYPVCVNSGTAALHLALVLAGVGRGDEVITSAQTMLATSQSILACGAVPVFADVQYYTGNLDPADILKRIGQRTKAILAVDWGGYPCDYDELNSISRQNGIVLIEDAAHALGAVYKGQPIGAVCSYTCFSFQAIKHITTGDGGLVCVPTAETFERAKRLRWFGIDRAKRQPSILGEPIWDVSELGYKYHMNDISASIGLGNLEDWDFIFSRRQRIAETYIDRLSDVPGIVHFKRTTDRQSANWLFSIHVERREDFCRAMSGRGIPVSVVHLRVDQNTLCGGRRNDLPELARFTETHISLPLHPLLSEEDVQMVVEAINTGW
jgi:perosamine synthetase